MSRRSNAGQMIRGSPTDSVSRKLLSFLLWAGGGVAVAVCILILLMWGIYGPNYLFDLIAAYCF